ncbi:hypothetical protein Zmor_013478 [Zophobas morio]|uniref:Uncharacterized protein n=1 Tax=Zophobas morio TaxID=2755281 RepID=A0AA38IHN1_9CUCU|nr:hypothetical protein Zmor_013478 [Zophobas morio]
MDTKNEQVNNGNSKTKKVLTYLAGFCDNTSIHGFRFLAERRRLVLEKIWWSVILCGCFYVCAKLIISTLKKRDENPIFISSSQHPMYLWDVPFPAIIVCSEIMVKQGMYNASYYFDKLVTKNLTDEEYSLKS